LKEEALDRTLWRNRFRGGFGPVVRQNTEWMNENHKKFYSEYGAPTEIQTRKIRNPLLVLYLYIILQRRSIVIFQHNCAHSKISAERDRNVWNTEYWKVNQRQVTEVSDCVVLHTDMISDEFASRIYWKRKWLIYEIRYTHVYM